MASDLHQELARKSYRAFGDAKDILDGCQKAGLPMALVTNGASDTQCTKLQAMDMHNRFHVVAISGETGFVKPGSRAFGPVHRALECPVQEIWHVGDSLATDLAGANAAGFTSVWLNRFAAPAEEKARPDIEITTLAELLKFIPAIEQANDK